VEVERQPCFESSQDWKIQMQEISLLMERESMIFRQQNEELDLYFKVMHYSDI